MSILRADSIRDRAGTGAPDFPNGLTGNVTGNVTGNTSGTAGGLTGTPNITVGTLGCGNVTSTGDVTGVNATFSGNLTVQGTTTTIDTAITEVDSLAVDGNVGIGSTLPAYKLDIHNSGTDNLRITTPSEGGVPLIVAANSNTATPTNQFFVAHSAAQVNIGNARSSNLNFHTGNTERVQITSGGTAIFKAGLAEKFQTGTTIQADPTIALSDGNIVLRTSNESGNQAINFTGVHSTLAVGEAVSFTVIITPNGSGAINNVQIDAATQTIQWSGGSAPSAGSSGKDVYTFTLLKTGSGTTDYDVYGAATNYA